MSRRTVGMRVIRRFLCCAVVAVIGQCLFAAGDHVAAEETVEFVITDERIVESSGLATDTNRQLYWTVNDSDDSGVAYALDEDGRTVGTVRYRATPEDVEAVAYNDGRLYIGDTGGNRRPREVVTVYEIDDPKPNDQYQSFTSRDFAYPDGNHDTEAILVKLGRILFVTKGPKGGEIFAASSGGVTGQPIKLERVAAAPPYITDGSFLPDGRIVLRSYVGLYVLDPRTYEVVSSAPTPPLKQGESVTVRLDGRTLLIGTEGEQSKVLRVPVPTTVRPVPTIPAQARTQSPAPGVESQAGSVASNSSDDQSQADESGRWPLTAMWLAVALLGAVAVAGAIALLRRALVRRR